MRNMPSAFSTTTWPTTMPGPIAASGCSRQTATNTCPRLGRQREPQSLPHRSSAVFTIFTASPLRREPHRRWNCVPLEPPMEFLRPTGDDRCRTLRRSSIHAKRLLVLRVEYLSVAVRSEAEQPYLGRMVLTFPRVQRRTLL